MRKILLTFAVVGAMAGCSDDEAFFGEGDGMGTMPERPVRTFTCTAGMEGAPTRTTLEGRNVLWDAGDEFCIKKQGEDYVFVGEVNQTSAGVGIRIPNPPTSTSVWIRYSDIKVMVNNVDRTTDAITASGNNTFKMGAYSEGGAYRYGAANTPMSITLKASNEAIPLVQTSSSSTISSSNPAVVTLKNVEYSFDQTNWTKLTSNSQLNNGFSNKKSVTSSVTQEGLDLRMALNDEPGRTIGEFTGSTTSLADIDASTMAVYPYASLTGYTNDNLSIALPEVQHYAENSFDHQANIMVGHVDVKNDNGEKCDATFKNMCGLLQLSLTGDNVYPATITLTDRGGAKLWGNATVPAASYADGISTSQLAGGSSTLTLDCSGAVLTSTPTLFTFVVPAGALASGFDVTVTTDDYRTQTFGTSRDNTVGRNDIVQMPTVAINNLSVGTINIENPAVQEYMKLNGTGRGYAEGFAKQSQNISFSSFGSTYANILTQALCMNQDRPVGLDLTWKGSADATYTVTLTDKTKGSDVYTDRSVTGNAYSITNLVPGHAYAYVVKSGGATVRSGEFNTTGQVRMVTIDDTWNCRDLGGWTGLDGHKVKYEWLFRTGSLNGTWKSGVTADINSVAEPSNYTFSANGLQQVRDLGILSELDLRGKTGDGQAWSQESGLYSRSLCVTHLPIDAADYKQIMTDQGLQQPLVLDNPITSSVVQDVAWIIDQVVNKNHPVVFHCKSGADRTGAVSMMVLSLLGVDLADVMHDYELTTMSREKLMVDGTSAFQTRRADKTTYGFFVDGFTTLDTGANVQEKAYYYLNQYFKESGVAISSSDLDAFIKKMLGLDSYTHPSFAEETGYTLQSIYNTQN